MFVPKSADPEILLGSARFRSRRRLPILTWIHPNGRVSTFCFKTAWCYSTYIVYLNLHSSMNSRSSAVRVSHCLVWQARTGMTRRCWGKFDLPVYRPHRRRPFLELHLPFTLSTRVLDSTHLPIELRAKAMRTKMSMKISPSGSWKFPTSMLYVLHWRRCLPSTRCPKRQCLSWIKLWTSQVGFGSSDKSWTPLSS